MSSKPATLPRWATDLTNNDAPSAGQADTGWTPNQVAVSDYFNYLAFWNYKWAEYLSDGELEGDVSIDGGLTVTGPAGVLVDADVFVGGDIDVDNVVATGDITAGGIVEGDTVTAVTATKHTHNLTLVIPSLMAEIVGAVATRSGPANAELNEIALNTSVSAVIFPIPLKVGDRIKSVSVFVDKNSASGTITAEVRTYVALTEVIGNLGSDTEAGVSPGFAILLISGLTTTILAGQQYYIRVTGGGTTGDKIYHAEVTYDRI